MEGAIVVLLIVAVVSGAASAQIATAKGHSGTGYFWLGFFMPLIGILVAGFMPPAEPKRQTQARTNGGTPRGSGTRHTGASDIYLPIDLDGLAELRPHDDRNTAAFLKGYKPKVERALLECAVAERILAFGIGLWRGDRVVFLLTDRRFVLVAMVRGQIAPRTGPVDWFRLNEGDNSLKSPEGVLQPSQRSPFQAPELADLIRDRQHAQRFVEMIAPGEPAPPSPSESAQRSTERVQPGTDTVSELERLNALRHDGAIDDAEFAELKRRLIHGDGD